MHDAIGELHGPSGFVYDGDGGGFTCGSDGGRPFPIPRRRKPRFPDPVELLESGHIETSIGELIEAAERSGGKISPVDILENPAEVAKKLGVKLSKTALHDLESVSFKGVDRISDPIQREVIGFLHEAARNEIDLKEVSTRPAHVADRLGLKLSDAALAKVVGTSGGVMITPAQIILGIIIVYISTRPGHDGLSPHFDDRSGHLKL